MGRPLSLGSAWDQPEEPAVFGGQQQQQHAVASAAAPSAVAEGTAVAVAEGGPAAGDASLSSH